MKNYWLDKKTKKNKIPTVACFQDAAVAFQKTRTTENALKLCEMFKMLVETILEYFGKNLEFGDRRQVIVEGMSICFTKLKRFNPDKGKAFAYFTTIVLGHLRQVYRTRRAYAELLVRQNSRKR